MKKKILIVGGTGFIGFYVAKKALKKNFYVESISTKKPQQKRKVKKVKYLICDISKKEKLKKVAKRKYDYVVNLGGYVNHNDKDQVFKSHYLGCKNLVDICKKIKIHTFVQMGSSGEYANSKSPHYEKLGKVRPSFGYNLAKYLSTKYIFTGWQIINKKFLYNFSNKTFSLKEAYDLAEKNGRLYGIIHSGLFFHVGDPKAHSLINKFIKFKKVSFL